MNSKKIFKLLFLYFAFTWSTIGYALIFDVPEKGDDVIGKVRIAQVKPDEDFSAVAERFDVGYYEIFEANPGIDPDDPAAGTVLVVPTRYVLPLELKNDTAVINLAEMRIYYKSKKENKIYIFPVAIGKESWETPLGVMTIVEKKENPSWTVPDSIYKFRKSIGDPIEKVIPPGPDNPLGKYAFRLSNRKYLVHGTNLPAGVGRRSTAGCIRMYNPDIELLYNLVSIGTKLIIINKPYKAGWLKKKLYLEAHMPLAEDRLVLGDDIQPALDVISAAAKGRDTKIHWGKAKEATKEHITIPRVVNF